MSRSSRHLTLMAAVPALLAMAVLLQWVLPSGHPAAKTGRATAPLGPVAARVGDIEVIDPFVPEPASASVAAFYATFRNLGSVPDALVGATTSTAGSSSLHTEVEDGTGGGMLPLARLVIPAGGSAALRPAHDHLMLENLRTTLVAGRSLVVELHFARAGIIDVRAPIVPLADLAGE